MCVALGILAPGEYGSSGVLLIHRTPYNMLISTHICMPCPHTDGGEGWGEPVGPRFPWREVTVLEGSLCSIIPPPEWREGIEMVLSSPLIAGGLLDLCVVTTGRRLAACCRWCWMLSVTVVLLCWCWSLGDSAAKCRSLSRGYIDINNVQRYYIIGRLILLVWIHS
jgi:hypothetical protein